MVAHAEERRAEIVRRTRRRDRLGERNADRRYVQKSAGRIQANVVKGGHRLRRYSDVRLVGFYAIRLPHTRCARLPLVGRGWGWGSWSYARTVRSYRFRGADMSYQFSSNISRLSLTSKIPRNLTATPTPTLPTRWRGASRVCRTNSIPIHSRSAQNPVQRMHARADPLRRPASLVPLRGLNVVREDTHDDAVHR